MKTLLLCTAAILAAGDAGAMTAAEAKALSDKGDLASQAGDYTQAADAYRSLALAGVGGSDAYFNLGTTELKAGRRGQAMLAFERALRVDPSDADAAFNLAEAQKSNIDKVVGTREEEPMLERIGSRIPGDLAASAFLGSWILGLTALLLRAAQRRLGGPLVAAAVVALAIAAVSGAALGAAAWTHARSQYALVVATTAPVREGPADGFKPAFEIHEGLKVRVVRVEKNYLRIRLPNGVEGWVADRDVPII